LRQTNALFSRQVSKNVLEEEEENLSLGARIADRVASFGGSWTFIGIFSFLMACWMSGNAIAGEKQAFDPFPFILLNLALSTVAALQAPVIMMSQNRQAAKDKALAFNDFQVNLKNETGIDTLLKGQAEVCARLTMIERIIEHRRTSTATPAAGLTSPHPRDAVLAASTSAPTEAAPRPER